VIDCLRDLAHPAGRLKAALFLLTDPRPGEIAEGTYVISGGVVRVEDMEGRPLGSQVWGRQTIPRLWLGSFCGINGFDRRIEYPNLGIV
jgi:hypothetical protein